MKRSVKMTAASLDVSLQDFTIAAYNCIYATLGLPPLDPKCPVTIPTKKRKPRTG
jgi:hypothetical protein